MASFWQAVAIFRPNPNYVCLILVISGHCTAQLLTKMQQNRMAYSSWCQSLTLVKQLGTLYKQLGGGGDTRQTKSCVLLPTLTANYLAQCAKISMLIRFAHA